MSQPGLIPCCPCQDPECRGITHPAMREIVARQIRQFGPTVAITRAGRTWDVPREYIAVHGVPQSPEVFRKLGFAEREAQGSHA